ncbi:MAG: hypothetical protein GX062_09425 [Firmicutes bacterium]|jgi:hypothetical protein|nr:hypothetical protein [Bacillota bacterium]
MDALHLFLTLLFLGFLYRFLYRLIRIIERDLVPPDQEKVLGPFRGRYKRESE